MIPDTLPFRQPRPGGRPATAPPDLPDVAVAALPLLTRLRDALAAAGRFRDCCRARQTRSHAARWGTPPLFFFDAPAAGLPAARFPAAGDAAAVTAADPLAAAAWDALPGLIDDALCVLGASVEARHAGRAVPDLIAAANTLAADHAGARRLADTLAVTDDEVVRVLHPHARAGFRLAVRGVADFEQFAVLLAHAVTGDPTAGRLPGPRPDPRAVAAYQGRPADDADDLVAHARFQFYRPAALRPGGTLPTGFAGADHWLWGRQPLSELPRIDGERVVLIGDPVVRSTWDVAPMLPHVAAGVDVLEVMSEAAVGDWLGGRRGQRGRRAA